MSKTIGILDSTRQMEWDGHYRNSIRRSQSNCKIVGIYEWDQIDRVKDLYALMFCGYFYNRLFNYKILEECRRHKVPIVYTDTGFSKGTLIVTINDVKCKGIEYAKVSYDNCNEEEQKKKIDQTFGNVKLGKWEKDKKSNAVLVLAHNFSGYSSLTKPIIQQHKECVELIDSLSGMGYEVILSNHPKHGVSAGSPNSVNRQKTQNVMDKGIKQCKFAVGWHSNALCNAVIKGVPVVCFDEDSFAYEIGSHSLDEPLIYPDRTQWRDILAWAQWSKKDIIQGKFWESVSYYINTKLER